MIGRPRYLGLGVGGRFDGVNSGWGCIIVKENGGFIGVNGLPRPVAISVQTVFVGGSLRGGGFCKNHKIISKEEVGYGGAVSGYFDTLEEAKGFFPQKQP